MAAMSKLPLADAVAMLPSWSTTWKTIVLLFAVVNIKSLPLTWHFRFYRSLFHHFYLRRNISPAPSHLFSPLRTTSRSATYECDLNGHKSNSTYFSDLDIARTHLVCHLTKKSFALRSKRKEPVMYVALAGVTALFRREIKPFQAYEISNRVLGWDGKWVWVVSHFVSPKPKRKPEGEDAMRGKTESGRTLYASCLSKYVFKSGRKTVSPEVVFTESGLLPPRPEGSDPLLPPTAVGTGANTPLGLTESQPGECLAAGAVRTSEDFPQRYRDAVERDAARIDNEIDATGEKGYWTWDRIEEERKRGLEVAACMLGLDKLEETFREGDEEGFESPGVFFPNW